MLEIQDGMSFKSVTAQKHKSTSATIKIQLLKGCEPLKGGVDIF